jgi:hypothetical protein
MQLTCGVERGVRAHHLEAADFDSFGGGVEDQRLHIAEDQIARLCTGAGLRSGAGVQLQGLNARFGLQLVGFAQRTIDQDFTFHEAVEGQVFALGVGNEFVQRRDGEVGDVNFAVTGIVSGQLPFAAAFDRRAEHGGFGLHIQQIAAAVRGGGEAAIGATIEGHIAERALTGEGLQAELVLG